MFVNSPCCFWSNVNILARLCEEPFPFASSALATLWCHRVPVGPQGHVGQPTVIPYPPSHAAWWTSSTSILGHILSWAGESWSLWLLLVPKLFHTSEDPGYPSLNLFPSSHNCDEDRCALCWAIPQLWGASTVSVATRPALRPALVRAGLPCFLCPTPPLPQLFCFTWGWAGDAALVFPVLSPLLMMPVTSAAEDQSTAGLQGTHQPPSRSGCPGDPGWGRWLCHHCSSWEGVDPFPAKMDKLVAGGRTQGRRYVREKPFPLRSLAPSSQV